MDDKAVLRRSTRDRPVVDYTELETSETISSGDDYIVEEEEEEEVDEEEGYGGGGDDDVDDDDEDDLTNKLVLKKFNFATSVAKCNFSSTLCSFE